MYRESLQVGCGEYDVYFAAVHESAYFHREAGSEKGGIGNRLRRFEQQIEVAALGMIIQPRTEYAYPSALPRELAGQFGNGGGLLISQAHGGNSGARGVIPSFPEPGRERARIRANCW